MRRSGLAGGLPVARAEDSAEVSGLALALPDFYQCSHDAAYHVVEKSIPDTANGKERLSKAFFVVNIECC